MSVNIYNKSTDTLKNVSGPSGGIVEGKPIYGPRVIYATNKALPKSGESPLTYTIDRDGILTGSVHKIGQGYSAFLILNDKALENLDNYGTESGTFSFPNIRVKTGDVIKISTNVPTTESTNVFMLNIISVIPIVGVEPGIELQAQDTYSLEEIKVGTWVDGKPIYRRVIVYTGSVGASTKIDSTLTYSYIDSIVSYNITGLDKGNTIIPISTAAANQSTGTGSCDWWIQSTGFYVGVGSSRAISKITAIFEYTKK